VRLRKVFYRTGRESIVDHVIDTYLRFKLWE
jgi:hypothetical protein